MGQRLLSNITQQSLDGKNPEEILRNQPLQGRRVTAELATNGLAFILLRNAVAVP